MNCSPERIVRNSVYPCSVKRIISVGFLALLATGCAATGDPTPTPDSPSDASTSAAPAPPTSTPPSQFPSPVAASDASPSPRPSSVVVDWNSGKGTAESPAPDPSPKGWYEAAFGGPPESQGKILYVTFDDGPANATSEVLQLLNQYDSKATFFVLGEQVAQFPETLAKLKAAGNAVGNHSWDHKDFTTLSSDQVAIEITDTQAASSAIGRCVRPPYGSIDQQSGETAVRMGYQPIMWTAQAWDWKPPPVDKIVADMKAGTKPGAVLLLHDGGGDRQNTVAALKQLLPYWKQQGYTLQAIPACA